MSTSALGKLCEADAQKDAIHIAIAPVIAAYTLMPGDRVGFIDKSDNIVCGASATEAIGIVDPFLTNAVKKGQMFYVCLFPNTVTGLRHDWAHPAFAVNPAGAKDPENGSKRWLEDFARQNDESYKELMARLNAYAQDCPSDDSGSYDAINSMLESEKRSLWVHYENVTGEKVSESVKAEEHFRCSC